MGQSQNTRIKLYVRGKIADGEWRDDEKIPSEQQLAQQFGVSRMTANRALNELAMERCIKRVQGVGSFVEKQVPQAPLFEIQSIRAEIESWGAEHTCRIIALESCAASELQSVRMDVATGDTLYFLEAVHLSGGQPLQLERRYVRPAIVPDFLTRDFSVETASDYLLRAISYTSVEHVVSAVTADAEIMQKLDLPGAEACLQLSRRTLIGQSVITSVDLIHPGEMFRLSGDFSPQASAERIAS